LIIFFTIVLINLGLTSESKDISKNNDMLLKRNLKTKNPCLCL